MGNRAYIVFEDEASKNFSPAIYLHWNGGPESVYAFLKQFEAYGCRKTDLPYAAARFCQLVGNFFGGTLSLGLQNVRNAKDLEKLTPGDNGLYVFAWIAKNGQPGKWRCRRMMEDYDQGEPGKRPVTWWTEQEVENEHTAALASDYWKDDQILKDIHAKNQTHFTVGQEEA